MLRAGQMRKWARGLVMASLAALGVALLATSAPAANTISFNPTGGGIGGTTNFGTLMIGTIDELPGNAIAVGFSQPSVLSPTGFVFPTVGSSFTLDFQANVGNLLDANGNPIFGYGVS